MKRIYLTEQQLKSILAEQVNEISYDKLRDAGDFVEFGEWDGEFKRPSLYDIEKALETIEETLNSVYRGSNQARVFLGYLSEMRAFFEKKKAQGHNFYDTASKKKQEYNDYLLNLAKTEFGYQGNDFQAFLSQLSAKDQELYDKGNFSDPNWNAFLGKINDPDIRSYAENHF